MKTPARWSVLLASLCVSCNSSEPIEPAYQPNMDPGRLPAVAIEENAAQAASSTGSGSTVNAPSSTKAVPASESRIDVSWKDNSTNESGFEVHRSTAGVNGAFALLASTGAGVIGYSDVGLNPLKEYCYKVRAFRVTGNKTSYSPFSATACANTPAPPPPPLPAAPSAVDAKPAASSKVIVRWKDNETKEHGIRIERSATSTGPWVTATVYLGFFLYFPDEGLASEQPVCYRVFAFNSYGDSPASNTDCTTPAAGPTNLTAAEGEPQTVHLTWNDNSAVEDGYKVWRLVGYPGWVLIADLPANSTSYADVGVSDSTTYSYEVRAKKDGGLSDVSNTASIPASDLPPSLAEICDNGVDDDNDGLIDVFDPDCSSDCPCGLGYICGGEGFCVPHCFDGVQNGGESDADCGGDGCDARCTTGQSCGVDADCSSGICGPDATSSTGGSCRP